MLSGCAVHSPMSEMLMFRDKEKPEEDGYYQARYSHALISVTSDYYPADVMNREGEVRDPRFSYHYEPARTWATHAIFLSDKTDRVGLSLAFGNGVGGDITVRLHDTYYLTGVLSGDENTAGQVILQKRLADGNPFGVGVGLTYLRNFNAILTDEDGCLTCYPSVRFYSHAAGVRFVFTLSQEAWEERSVPFLYLTGNLNYDFTVETVFPRIGLAFGFY